MPKLRLGTKADLNEFDPECSLHQRTKADLSEFDATSEVHMTRRHRTIFESTQSLSFFLTT